MDALPSLGMTGAVKQQALQRLNHTGIHFCLHDVRALAAQIRVAIVILVGVNAVAAVGADFIHDAADAHDPVGVVVHFYNEQRRFIRDVGFDGNGRLVNAPVFRVCGEPLGSLAPGLVVVSRDADGECLSGWGGHGMDLLMGMGWERYSHN